MNQSPLNPPQPLPCMHTWEFKIEADGDYFVCTECHRSVEYDPADLADIEQEMRGEGYE